jgi:bifunctional non-homologous end joining protein LigD
VVGHGTEFFSRACRLGLEGIVSKRRDAPYRPGRGADWLKIKCLHREEVAVIGWTAPQGSRTGIGALLLGYYDAAGRLHYAGKVGTGFKNRDLLELKRRLEPLHRGDAPFDAKAEDAPRNAVWVKPDLVAELRFSEWTPDRRLRHPSFLGLREDKRGRGVVIDPAPGVAVAPPPAKRGRSRKRRS